MSYEIVEELGADIAGGEVLRAKRVDLIRHIFVNDRHVAGTGQIGVGRTWRPPPRLFQTTREMVQSRIAEERGVYQISEGQPPSSFDCAHTFKGRHSHMLLFSDSGVVNENIFFI